ncbi:50S ribosomal protein L11 methyltransferase [Synergistales bacterium]|nr:50S ribosomal protein L11 methyltransferase [Synergistales bacterium]
MKRLEESFRDPNGFVYVKDNVLLRQVNDSYKSEYDALMDGGLYNSLVEKKWIIHHQEEDLSLAYSALPAYKILKPEPVPYISYPFEWCFEQYKSAALLTLDICLEALRFSMILKDASSYNIQFIGSRPVFIDTLSFEKYTEGHPWIAYGQFCKHFLAPILLMSKVNVQLSQLMRVYIDGIPIELAADLLPQRYKFAPSIYMHIFLHAKMLTRAAVSGNESARQAKAAHIRENALIFILNNMRSLIAKCEVEKGRTEWGEYYENMMNYSDAAFRSKALIVKDFLSSCSALNICDMGGNRGEFSKIASEIEGSYVVCYDIDHTAVNRHYSALKSMGISNILPLTLDLTNPSPAIGWANEERKSIPNRADWDCTMALALIHHLAISNNLPLYNIADYFSRMSPWLIIEFVPKEDEQVQKLLRLRQDIFTEYNVEGFEKSFSLFYDIIAKREVQDSLRTIYLLKRK